MDLTLSPQEQEFRDELRAWLDENHPGPEPEGDEAAFEFRKEWQRKLADAGWAGLSWPEEYGGRGASLIEQALFNEEMVRSRAPMTANVLGLVMGGPVVIAHGTEEQKKRYLKPILTAEEIWCQGFSEPDSGSEKPWHQISSAVRIGSRKRSFCSSVPWAITTGPPITSPSTFAVIGARERTISSLNSACSISVAPRPPYSSGHDNPA